MRQQGQTMRAFLLASATAAILVAPLCQAASPFRLIGVELQAQ
jgi:hypothetical protein